MNNPLLKGSYSRLPIRAQVWCWPVCGQSGAITFGSGLGRPVTISGWRQFYRTAARSVRLIQLRPDLQLAIEETRQRYLQEVIAPALAAGGPERPPQRAVRRRKGEAMTRPGTGFPQWAMVDEGWGRQAVDFATLSEPGNCREYVAVHHRLGVDAGDRLLDVACGSGLAIELARLRGASCSGIDASARLVAVARDRNPECDIRVGDMHALPWDPASFEVVTSFRGIWGTTPDVVAEIHRVLRPGGRAGITVWGHLKASPGAWALAPFRLAAAEKVDNQAVMVSLGRPGAGEQLLQSYGFVDVERVDVPFAAEFADPDLYARALASTGPAYEAIQNVGEAEFHRAAVEQAQGQLRDGLPLRAEINVVGYLARKPEGAERA
jgi:SAM-dependent methyltransferase